MPITRTAFIDDDGTGKTGTVWDNAEKQRLYDQIDAALLVSVSAQQSYTPGWRASAGAAPAIGNGSLIGRFTTLGNLVWVNILLAFGSTTSAGGGGWIFSLPPGLTFASNAVNAAGMCFQGSAYAVSGAYGVGNSEINPFAGAVGAPGVAMDPTHPTTWASGHWMDYYVMYRRT